MFNKKKKNETIEEVVANYNNYPNVKKAVHIFNSCVSYHQKIVALNYARLAIKTDVQPVGNKPEHIDEMWKERAGLERFFTALIPHAGLDV